MHRLLSTSRRYAWGSPTAIPEMLGAPADGVPVAEAWFGAHPSAPSVVQCAEGPVPLDELVRRDPSSSLGDDVVARFGTSLPYLLKLIAAERPLSLQVHPSLERAREGYASEDADGVPVDDPRRNYRDRNHKPELVYALTRFEALCGFRAPRRAAEMLDGLDAPLAARLRAMLRERPTAEGICAAFTELLEPATRPSRGAIDEVVAACAARLAAGSPSPRADRAVLQLAEAYPGDPGSITSLLLNPVTLHPEEAMFVPAGGVHAYLSGVAVELMASSDNVLRAGLTDKHIDIPELLRNVDYVGAPPIRIAPEVFHGATRCFYAPVDDFELSVTAVEGDDGEHPLPGRGPRILLCLDGEVVVTSVGDGEVHLRRGESVFVPASDGPLHAHGLGTLVQADVP